MNDTIDRIIVRACKPSGELLGPEFTIKLPYPSKTGLVAWMFNIISLLRTARNPVASLTTRVVRSAFTSDGSSPSGPTLPKELLNKQPFYVAGTLTGKGSSSASVLKVQKLNFALMDSVTVTDSGTVFYPSAKYTISWTDRRDGITLSKWRSLIRAGTNATTPMTAQRGVVAARPGSMTVRYKRSYDTKINAVSVAGQTAVVTPVSFSVAGLTSNLDARALEKLHGKLYALEHDARIGETLGEYRQAISMIGRPLDGLRRLIALHERRAVEVARNVERRVGRSLSRFDARDVKELNAALAALYLEFNFGWKPLALDVVAAIKAINAVRNGCATVVNASFTGDAVYSDDTISDAWNSYCYFNTRTVKRVKTTVRYKVGIDPVKVEVGNYMERVGVTPREFIPTLYAILPYSWLFDYFTGMNASIEALCADLSFTTWTCKTVRSECVTEITSNPDIAKARSAVGTGFIDANGVPAVASSTLVVVARSVPSSLIPSPVLRLPQAIKPWANIAALALQRKVGNAGFLANQLIALAGPKTP